MSMRESHAYSSDMNVRERTKNVKCHLCRVDTVLTDSSVHDSKTMMNFELPKLQKYARAENVHSNCSLHNAPQHGQGP